MGTVIATPQDICKCGHRKVYHVWLKTKPIGQLLERVVQEGRAWYVADCHHQDCPCQRYESATEGAKT